MQLNHEFTVPVPAEQAWTVLLDIARIAPCLPGAVIDSVTDDGFTGRVKVKVGPIAISYAGKGTFVERDRAAGRVLIDAAGKETRGSGTAKASIAAQLHDEGPSTRVTVQTDLAITGKPAQFGRGVMVDVGNKLLGQFADCLAERVSDAPAGEPAVAAPPVGDPGQAATPAPDEATPAADQAPAELPASSAAPANEAEPAPAAPANDAVPANEAEPASTAPAAAPPRPPAAVPPRPPAAAPPTPAAASPSATPTMPAAATEPIPIDLVGLAGGAVLKRLAPVVGLGVGLGVIVALIVNGLRRRSNRGR